MQDHRIELSRRKLLASAGVVGAAGVGAGLGTSALFTDEESYVNNSITAGTLDMRVQAEIVAANQYWEEQGIVDDMAVADGAGVVGLQAEDVKPGDWVIICFDISIGDNPGYVRISTDDFAQYENGQTEPESAVDDSGGGSLGSPLDGSGAGELQDHLVAEVYDSFDGSADGDPPRSHLGGPHPNLSGTARTAYEQFATGVVLGGSTTPIPVGSGDDAAKRYLLLELPRDAGNEIQSDAIEFDLVFEARQVRNNDGFEPESDLISYHPLNSIGDGTAEDLSSNGNHGSIAGDVSPVDGQVAGAAMFDGAGDYVEVSGDAIFDLSDFTLALWFETDGFDDSIGVLTNKQDPGDRYADRNWWLAIDNGHGFAGGNGHLAFRTSAGGSVDVDLVGGSDVRDDSWHHVVAVVDSTSGSASLYVDGSEEASQSPISTPDTQPAPIQLGKEIGRSGRYFGGAMDEVRIYDRALTSSEVSTLHSQTM